MKRPFQKLSDEQLRREVMIAARGVGMIVRIQLLMEEVLHRSILK